MRRIVNPGVPAAVATAVAVAIVTGLVLPSVAAHAAGPLGGPGSAGQGPTGLAGIVAGLSAAQQSFQLMLVGALQALRDAPAPATFGTLAGAGFLYGVVHAAGPGHGKVILSGYLLTHPVDRRRAVSIAAAAALLQGVVAVVLVGGLVGLADLAASRSRDAARWVEIASFGLVVAVGLVLLAGALRRAVDRAVGIAAHGPAHHHRPGEHHDRPGEGRDCCAPSADRIEAAHGPLAALGLVASCGLRPCTGAVLVLVLAFGIGLPGPGIAAVAAMSVGTGLTVTVIALAARSIRLAVAGAGGRLGLGAAAGWAGIAAAAAGGLLVTASGVLLTAAAFQPRHPLL